MLALSADGASLFVAYSDGVYQISTSDNQLIGSVPGVPSGFAVGAIATTRDGKHLFVGGSGGLLELNQSTGALVNSYNLGPNVPVFMVGALSGNFPVEVYGDGMVLSPDGSSLYIADGEFGDVEDFNTSTQQVTTLPSPVPPAEIAITPDGSEFYVTGGSTSLGVINLSDPYIGATIPVGGSSAGISIR